MNRRKAMQALAALAAGEWAAEGYDLEDVDGWGPADGGTYHRDKWRFSPEYGIGASVDGVLTGLNVTSHDLTDFALFVHYDSRSVNLDMEGTGEDGIRGGAIAMLEPEQARELAVAIYMAAEELGRRGAE